MGRVLRYKYSDEGIQKRVDNIRNKFSPEDAEEKINNLYKNNPMTHLTKFVKFIDQYANQLANKKSVYDRSTEELFGRWLYKVSETLSKRFAANAVVGNIASASTNVIPLSQMRGEVSFDNILRGIKSYANSNENDYVSLHSTFLTNRQGTDKLIKSTSEKVTDFLSIPMNGVDMLTSNIVVRGKYEQNLRNGMTQEEALKDADRFANNLMASRTKASLPTIFNSKNALMKTFTMFQVEVNNQYSYLFKDLPKAKRDKGLFAIAWGLFKIMLSSYIINDLYEKLFGRRPATDVPGIANSIIGDVTGKKLNNGVDFIAGILEGEGLGSLIKTVEKKDDGDAFKDALKDVGQEVPFVGSFFDGGRIPGPGSSVVPAVKGIGKGLYHTGKGIKETATRGKFTRDAKTEFKRGGIDLLDASNFIFPYAGGQISKTVKGLGAVISGGSFKYDENGEKVMQFPVTNDSKAETVKNYIQGAIGGKTALDDYATWQENGRRNLTKKEQNIYLMMTNKYNAEKNGGKVNYSVGANKQNVYQTILDLKKAEDEREKQTVTKFNHNFLQNNKLLSRDENAKFEYLTLDSKMQKKVNALSNTTDTKLWKALEMVDKYTPDKYNSDGKGISGAEYYRKYLPKDAIDYVNSTTYEEKSTDMQKLALLYDGNYSPKQKSAYEKFFILEKEEEKYKDKKEKSGFYGEMNYNNQNAFYYSALSDGQKARYIKNKYLFPNMDLRTYFYYLKEATTEGTSKKNILRMIMDNGMTYQEADKFYNMAFSNKKQYKAVPKKQVTPFNYYSYIKDSEK